MLQRKQTVFLVLAIIFNAAFFLTGLFDHAQADPGGWLMPLVAASVGFSVLLSAYTVALYKNRPKQMKFCGYSMLFQVIAIGSGAGILMTIGGIGKDSISEITGISLLVFAWIFQFLAIRGIKSDEKLIKSIDRIR